MRLILAECDRSRANGSDDFILRLGGTTVQNNDGQHCGAGPGKH